MSNNLGFYKKIGILIITFLIINIVANLVPITISQIVGQYHFTLYLLLSILAYTTIPVLFLAGVFTKNYKLLLAVLIYGIINYLVVGDLQKKIDLKVVPFDRFTKETVNEEKLLNISNITTQENLKKYSFCFQVYLPNLPNYNHDLDFEIIGFDSAKADNRRCNEQLLALHYSPWSFQIIEVPRSYDFNFRADYEDLGRWKEQALKGERVSLQGVNVYKSSIVLYNDFFNDTFNTPEVKDETLYYFEKGNTLVFLLRDSNLNYSEKNLIDIISSMREIHENNGSPLIIKYHSG